MADTQIAKEAAKHFKRQGLDIRLGAKMTGAIAGKTGVNVSYEDSLKRFMERYMYGTWRPGSQKVKRRLF